MWDVTCSHVWHDSWVFHTVLPASIKISNLGFRLSGLGFGWKHPTVSRVQDFGIEGLGFRRSIKEWRAQEQVFARVWRICVRVRDVAHCLYVWAHISWNKWIRDKGTHVSFFWCHCAPFMCVGSHFVKQMDMSKEHTNKATHVSHSTLSKQRELVLKVGHTTTMLFHFTHTWQFPLKMPHHWNPPNREVQISWYKFKFYGNLKSGVVTNMYDVLDMECDCLSFECQSRI